MSGDDGWEISSEGDLDPDLTEEAGYAGWDPPERRWLVPLLRAIAVLLIAALVAGAVGFVLLR